MNIFSSDQFVQESDFFRRRSFPKATPREESTVPRSFFVLFFIAFYQCVGSKCAATRDTLLNAIQLAQLRLPVLSRYLAM